MNHIRIFLLWLQWKLFGRRSVVLIDFDGEITTRLVHGFRSHLYAKRFGFGVANVALLPGGKIGGVSYVDCWEPLFPADFAPPSHSARVLKEEPHAPRR